MSRLTRHLLRSMKEVDGSLSWVDKLSSAWDNLVERCTPQIYYKVRAYAQNFILFNKLAWNWRSWDSSFSIDVLCTLIKEHGKACRDGWSTRGKKGYRRALRMAGQLDRAYNYSILNDQAYMYIARKYPFQINNRRFYRGYPEGGVVDKMHSIASNRVDQLEKQLKQEAWEYIGKHIDELWD